MTTQERSLAIFACILWGSAFTAGKIGVAYMTPLILVGIRFLLAGMLLLPWSLKRHGIKRLWTKQWRRVLLLSFFSIIGPYALLFMALPMVRGAQASILNGATPLTAMLVAHFFMHNDKMTRQKVVSVSLGMVGIIVMSVCGKSWDPVGVREVVGLLIMFVGLLLSGFGYVMVARSKKANKSPVAMASMQMMVGGALMLIVGLVREEGIIQPLTTEFYLSLAWLAMLSAVAFTIWFLLLKTVPVSELNLWQFLTPVSGALLSWLLIANESPDFYAIIGMLLVGSGILAGSLMPKKKSAPISPPAPVSTPTPATLPSTYVSGSC